MHCDIVQLFEAMAQGFQPEIDHQKFANQQSKIMQDDICDCVKASWEAHCHQVVIKDVLGLKMSCDTVKPHNLAAVIESSLDVTMIDIIMCNQAEWDENCGVKILPSCN